MNHLLSAPLPETQNQAWANDKSGFGFKMLLKMGWKEGKGLGKDQSGITSHVKVTKRLDARGIGAEMDAAGNSGWAEQAHSFNSILSQLGTKYGKGGESDSSAGSSSKKKSKKSKKEKKEKKKKDRKQAEEGGEKKSKKRKRDKDSESSDEKKKKKKVKPKHHAHRHRLGRARVIQSKSLHGYSARDMAAVLGIAQTA